MHVCFMAAHHLQEHEHLTASLRYAILAQAGKLEILSKPSLRPGLREAELPV